ncbi:hypothetical protein [Acaryochloris thomasi]|nr:hypothetical protein [Acaryochloris thomasi]
MSNAGGKILSEDIFDSQWPLQSECYRLTLGTWGSGYQYYDQMSRQGKNLVLQLNFSSKHNRPYQRLIRPDDFHPFEYEDHPISDGGHHTLAWSRIDLDLNTGEALIEEIQNDWIRFALRSKAAADHKSDSIYFRGSLLRVNQVREYVDQVLLPHIKLWDEAMLAATIWFLREELGIKKIFYHTYESGATLKKIAGTLPPRSLYTALPKKFCFRETHEQPTFLNPSVRNKKRRQLLSNARFQLLSWQS